MRFLQFTRPFPVLAPLPHLHESTFRGSDASRGGSHPHGVLLLGPTLIFFFFVKAFGSIKNGGPSTRKRQIGEICQAFNTTAFASFKRTMEQCTVASQGTIAFFLHMVSRTALFFFPLPVHSVAVETFSSVFPVFLAWHRICLSMPPGNLCHAGGWHLRRKPRVALSSSPLFFPFLFADWCRTALNCESHCVGVHSNLSSNVCSGYAFERSDVTASSCIHRRPIAPVASCYDKYACMGRFQCLPLLRCVLSRLIILMAEWICRWKPFWIRTGGTFQKAYFGVATG